MTKKKTIGLAKWLVVIVAILLIGNVAQATKLFDFTVGHVITLDDSLQKFVDGGQEEPSMGGLIHNIQESFDAGIAVQGVEIITSAGVFTPVTLNASGITTLSGDTNINKPILGTGQVDFGFFDDAAADNATATAAQMCDYSKWIFATDVPITVGLPDATSTIADCIQTVGSCKTVRIENQSTTSAGTITFVAVDQRYDGFGATSMYFASSSEATVGDLQSATLIWCNDDGATTTLDIIPYWKNAR